MISTYLVRFIIVWTFYINFIYCLVRLSDAACWTEEKLVIQNLACTGFVQILEKFGEVWKIFRKFSWP